MNALLPLIEHLNYDYRDLSIVLLVVEQRDGKEAVDRLLEEIPAPQVRKNAKHFVNRLRELCEGEKSLPESRKLPGEKKYGNPVLKEG
jgi:hypothetical protein